MTSREATADLSPQDRHRRFAEDFATLTRQVDDWEAPAPVAGWTARDVVGHLVEWFPGFLAAGGVELPSGPAVAEDPVAAWQHQADAVQAVLDTRGDEQLTHPRVGSHRLADAVDMFYTADVFMHSWDLARASGQTIHLDEQYASRVLEGMRPIEEMLRSSGQYGAAVPVAEDAPVADRLMGFIGRDPAWQPPTR
jgi:uncharacterized protein (TIGR03086 family)